MEKELSSSTIKIVAEDSKCKEKMPTTTSLDSFPDDLLLLILVCLPADCLYEIARFVCSRWYHIISSRSFMNAHHQKSAYYLLYSYPYYYFSYTEDDGTEQDKDNNPSLMMTPTLQGLIQTNEFSYIFIGKFSCTYDGLVLEELICKENERVIILRIINPATKHRFLLPFYDGSVPVLVTIHNCGIAYAAASKEFKVAISYFTSSSYTQPWGLALLTLGVDNSWREVEVDHYLSEPAIKLLANRPLLTEGFMHWVKQYEGQMVVTLDVETEILTVSQLPSPALNKKSPKFFFSTGRTLSMFIGRGFCKEKRRFLSLWEMNPKTKEWMMLVDDIKFGDEQQQQRLQQLGIGSGYFLEPYGWVKYPEVLAFCVSDYKMGRNVISYNLHTHEINLTEFPAQKPLMDYTPSMYKKSLLWFT